MSGAVGTVGMGPVVLGGWIEHRPSNRGVYLAAACSFVFHAALLVGWHGLHKPEPLKPAVAPGPIVARLAAPAQVAPAAEPVPPTPEPPKPRAEEPPPPPPPVAKPVPSPVAKPAPVAKAAPSPAPAPVAAPAKPSADPAPSAAPPVAAAPSAAPAKPDAAATAPAPAAPAPASDADPGTLRQYQLAIITTARKYKRYPRAAMDNNWEGKVEVRMVIGANGMIASISVKTSTGHELLDKTALDMITKAKPLTPIPAALRGKEFTVDVPVVFSLKEDAPSG